MAAPSLLSKLVAVIVIALAAGSHELDLSTAPQIGESAMQGPAGHQGFTGMPAGDWEATGRTVETDGPGTGWSHRSLPGRHWRFVTRCDGSRCRTLFLRTTPSGIQRTVMHARRGHFTATFGPVPQPCEGVPGTPGNYVAHFRLRWSRDGRELFAREHGRYGGGCSVGWTWTRWTAIPAPAGDGSSEASDQVL